MTGETTDETRPLDDAWQQAAREARVPCAHAGCGEPVTHVRCWRTEAMPAPAYDYLCTEHAAIVMTRVVHP